MRFRDIKTGRIYVYHDPSLKLESPITCLFIPEVLMFEKAPKAVLVLGPKVTKIVTGFNCRILAHSGDGYEAEVLYELAREDVRFVQPAAYEDLPLYLGLRNVFPKLEEILRGIPQ